MKRQSSGHLGEGHSWSDGQREGRAFVLKGSHETKVFTGSHSPYLVLHPFLFSPPPYSISLCQS